MIRNSLTALGRQAVRFVPVGISARHVHLSQADLQVLFGAATRCSRRRELSLASLPPRSRGRRRPQGGSWSGSGSLARSVATQVELAMTDAMKLGIKAPVRMSGDLAGSPVQAHRPGRGTGASPGRHRRGPAYPYGWGQAGGLRPARRRPGLSARQSARPCVWGDVIIRAGKGHDLEMHIDTDEANSSALLSNGAYVELVADHGGMSGSGSACGAGGTVGPGHCSGGSGVSCGGGIGRPGTRGAGSGDRADVNDAIPANQAELLCTQRAIITRLRRDRSAATGLQIRRVREALCR